MTSLERQPSTRSFTNVSISLNGHLLHFSDEVIHLGHILTFNLNDKSDIIRATKDLNCKTNYTLSLFKSADPFVKCFLIDSLFIGGSLWSLCSPSLRLIQVALNNILRKVWRLPHQSHTSIVHYVSQVLSNILLKQYLSHLSSALSSPSPLVKSVYSAFSMFAFSITGYNNLYGHHHLKTYTDDDFLYASIIRDIRWSYGLCSPFESYIKHLSCRIIILISSIFGGAVVGPGALKPTVGDGIESRRPLIILLSLFFPFFHICIYIGVYNNNSSVRLDFQQIVKMTGMEVRQ